jgi:hypothetical protein
MLLGAWGNRRRNGWSFMAEGRAERAIFHKERYPSGASRGSTVDYLQSHGMSPSPAETSGTHTEGEASSRSPRKTLTKCRAPTGRKRRPLVRESGRADTPVAKLFRPFGAPDTARPFRGLRSSATADSLTPPATLCAALRASGGCPLRCPFAFVKTLRRDKSLGSISSPFDGRADSALSHVN